MVDMVVIQTRSFVDALSDPHAAQRRRGDDNGAAGALVVVRRPKRPTQGAAALTVA